MPRRVVRGPQDSKAEQDPSNYSRPGTSRQNLQSSIDQSLNNMQADNLLADIDQSKHESVMDQYPSISGGRILQANRRQDDRQYNQPNQQSHEAPRVDRQAEIKDLMSRYQAANKQSARRKGASGLAATSIAFSNPAAAAQYAKAYQGYNTQPVDSITGGQKSSLDQVGINKGTSAQVNQDEQDDGESQVSRLYVSKLSENGIKVPPGTSATAIKKVFPFIQLDVKTDAQKRGQDIASQTATQNRASKQKIAQADRFLKSQIANNKNASQQRIAQLMARAGIDKAVIDSTIDQYLKGGGIFGGGGRASDAAGLTFPNMSYSAGENKYLARDLNQGPPTQQQKAGQRQRNAAFSRYSGSINDLKNYIQDVRGGIEPFNYDTASKVLSAYNQTIDSAVKYFGNGVANGPDIQRAKKALGDPDSLMSWIMQGNDARLDASLKWAQRDYERGSASDGYLPSKQPHKGSQMNGGPGGGNGSNAGPLFDPADAANQALRRNDLPPVKKKEDAKTPVSSETPTIPNKTATSAGSVDLDKKKKAADALNQMGF